MEPTNTLLRHRTPVSPVSKPIDTSSPSHKPTNKQIKRHTFGSIQSIFWTGCATFTILLGIMVYYTTYYLPSSEQTQQFITDKIDNNETIPFGFNNYPFDTPYELRDISKYSRIVAIGDLHGDIAQTHKILQLTNILDNNYKWIAKDTILIQTGDIVDRGQESIEVYKLFFRLRNECKSHNSLVLQLLGNHEMMNIGGDFRYVHGNEMYKYGSTSEWKQIWSMKHKIGYFLRNTPIIRIIGNTLFVHAGLRPEILQIVNNENITNKLNELVLKGNSVENFDFEHYLNDYYDYLTIVGNNGPMWTREFEPRFYSGSMYNKAYKKLQLKTVRDDKLEVIEEYVCEQVNKTLSIMNVKKMVIGHNVQLARVPRSRCDGKLFSIDVGISCAYGCGQGAITIDIQSDIVSIVTS